MVKLNTDKGFTLLEMMMVMMILVILTLFSINSININQHPSINEVTNQIVLTQFQAINQCEWQEYDDNGIYIHYNRLGNVRQANTYEIDSTRLVVTLATGRVYVKQ